MLSAALEAVPADTTSGDCGPMSMQRYPGPAARCKQKKVQAGLKG
jgi:hypothetical protein